MLEQLNIIDAKIGYKNFSGNPSAYNKEGKRGFVIFLEEEQARELEEKGLTIKWPKPNEYIDPEHDNRLPFLKVSVSFDKPQYAPKVVVISDDNATLLEEHEVYRLDQNKIKYVDLSLRLSPWEVNDRKGIKAYLASIYCVLDYDELAMKYGI